MRPGRYDVDLYDGDSYLGPEISLPSLAPFGGPSELSGSEVRAHARASALSEDFVAFDVEVTGPRALRLSMPAAAVRSLPERGVWDLEVSRGAFVGTVLAGVFRKRRQVTR